MFFSICIRQRKLGEEPWILKVQYLQITTSASRILKAQSRPSGSLGDMHTFKSDHLDMVSPLVSILTLRWRREPTVFEFQWAIFSRILLNQMDSWPKFHWSWKIIAGLWWFLIFMSSWSDRISCPQPTWLKEATISDPLMFVQMSISEEFSLRITSMISLLCQQICALSLHLT